MKFLLIVSIFALLILTHAKALGYDNVNDNDCKVWVLGHNPPCLNYYPNPNDEKIWEEAHAKYQASEQADYTIWYYLGVGVIGSFVFGLLFDRLRRSRLMSDRTFYSLPSSPAFQNAGLENTREGNDIVQTQVQEEHTISNWNEELWKEVKTNFPRDWEKILKWISENTEDVNIIIKNSKDNREALYKLLERAREEGFGEDMK